MTVAEEIQKLKKEKDAIILAHYYVRPEVQDVADYIGDSFYLSKIAASAKEKTIVFCGVGFMGASATILSQDKTVLMPAMDADCPMAHMATEEGIRKVREEYDDVAVVCYINSTAALKELSDVCVTSANAVKIVKALPNKNIFFIPDRNLAHFIAEQVPEKHFIYNEGFCIVHEFMDPEEVKEAKEAHPEALVLAHPECPQTVLKQADYIGSTSGIIKYAQDSNNKEFIICTECGVQYKLETTCPDKKFYFTETVPVCKNMKKVFLEKVLHVLKTGENEEKKQRNRWSECWNLQNRDREAKTMKIKTDVVIVGTGVAGMFSALKLPRDKKIVIITKEDMRSSDSFLAQGGICVLRDENDYDSYFEDTMKAGHYENRKESVDIMIRGSRDVINDLVGYGVDFKMDGDDFAYTREGAHSKPRILYHEDITGKEISEKLLGQVLKLENVTVLEYTSMQDILVENGKCIGLKAVSAEANKTRLEAMEAGKNVKIQEEIQPGGELPVEIYAEDTILASGGIGGRYQHSTNYPHLTGDALDIAKKHNVRLEHLDYVQIHPTTLYSKKPGRRFLISESVRGEGAVLYNSKKERFVNELLPRDVVTKAIQEEMKKEGTDHVWLSMENIDKDTILHHFPHIYERCLEEGYDVTKECIPVVPAQHYFMGGIWVDSDSKTSMDQLYAVGETSCNGVHGANRLASNSLLESLVFAKRAAKAISTEKKSAAGAA